MSALYPLSQKALPRAHGKIELEFDKTGLNRLFQSGCAKLLLPRTYNGIPEGVLVNTAGGLTGGDSFGVEIKVHGGTSLCLTSQTAERIYKSNGGDADISNIVYLGKNSSLDWLPQETILFDRSALKRRLQVDMAEDARLLAVETLVLGRGAMGETLGEVACHDSWRIRRGGRMVFADALAFSNPKFVGQSAACLGGAKSVANVLYVAPDAEQCHERVRRLLELMDIEAACSAWNGVLSIRMIDEKAEHLRKALISFLIEFRGQKLPRVWHM